MNWLEQIRKDHAERECDLTLKAVEDAGGNLTKAGRTLGMSRGGVIARLQKYGLLPPHKRKPRPKKKDPESGNGV